MPRPTYESDNAVDMMGREVGRNGGQRRGESKLERWIAWEAQTLRGGDRVRKRREILTNREEGEARERNSFSGRENLRLGFASSGGVHRFKRDAYAGEASLCLHPLFTDVYKRR